MPYNIVSPFEFYKKKESDDIVHKIFAISDYHICYWEFNPTTGEYQESSNYGNIVGQTFSDFSWPQKFLSPESWEVYSAALNNLLENELKIDLKLQLRSEKKWIRIVTDYSRIKGVYQGVVKDITSEMIIETSLRNRTIELSAFDEGLDSFSIVARTDPKGKIIYANKEFCRLSKYTYDELIGQDHRIVNSGHHPKDFFKDMWASILEGNSWRGTIKNKAKDGTFYWVDTIIIPIRDENDELLEILSFRFDITKMQKYKEEILNLREELANLQKNKS